MPVQIFVNHQSKRVLILFVLLINGILGFSQKSEKGIYFSHDSGFYDAPFDLSISAANIAAVLYYTIDGSNPATSVTRISAGQQATIRIDPMIDTIRPVTPAFLVRSIAMISDSAVTEHVSATYIFIEQVKTQNYPGGGWPLGNMQGQLIDLNMDRDPQFANVIKDALMDIPSISVVTDNNNLFGAQGIYVNAMGHGENWERPCSIELINPDGSEGFYENAGIRIRGGWSRHADFPKHAFRFFFKTEYGTPKLRFPLFGSEGAVEFDKIDLRCEQNYAWSNSDGSHNTLIREVFARDSQGKMGRPYTRSRYYHLYLNGMYWGIYQTQERSEARYAETYFGGNSEDYDVVKVNVENYIYEIEATDGDLNTWRKVWNLCQIGFNNANFYQLEGKNSVGKPMSGGEVLVDIDNLIDYMIIIFYTGSFDAPVSQFLGNDKPNNFYAIKDRTDKSKGFVFLAHDNEHSMMIDAVTVGKGIDENRVSLGSIYGDDRMEITEFRYFNPQWLHHKLTTNAEYRMRFADRASLHLSNDGIFTPERARKSFDARAAEIDMAIIAESARWGDTKGSPTFTKENAWIPELNGVRSLFFPRRTNIVISQLKQAGLFSGIEAPDFIVADSLFNETSFLVDQDISITFKNPNSAGEIFYTRDGNDPRSIGGGVNAHAEKMTDGQSVLFEQSALIKARIRNGTDWSALRTVALISAKDDLSQLKITEIHYHPKDQIRAVDTLESKDLEFLEFKNIGETALNLSGVKIDSAVNFTFPENTVLPPGQFYVIASKPSKFYEFYGLHASGNFNGNLSNSGEDLLVTDAQGNTLIQMTYKNVDPWPKKVDGDGPSLVAIEFNPPGDPADYGYWRPSIFDGGTPFRDDELITALDEKIGNHGKSTLQVSPNPTDEFITISVANMQREAILGIKILNLNGQIIHSGNILNHESISLKHLNLKAGLYVLSVQHELFFESTKILIK